jgi:phage tail sheath protein FI
MSDPYYGVEIIETGSGSTVATETKAATCFLIGTAPIGDMHGTDAERAKYVNNAIIIRSREDGVAAFGEHSTGYTLPAAIDAIFDQAGANGIGTLEIVNVFDPAVHATVADVTNLDIIGGFTAAGQPQGLKIAYDSYQRFGRFCKILGAPGFTGMTGVRAELETICNRIRGRAVLDAPIGAYAHTVIEARGASGSFDWQFSNRRMVPVWPHMNIVDLSTGGERLDPYSSRFIGVWLRTIMDNGYHHSPSNRPIYGIEGSEVPVLYVPGDKQSDVQLLRDAGIVTIEERYGSGPHTSGNRSSAHPTDTDMRNFLHVQFIEDMLDESVMAYLDQHKDRNGNPARIETLEEGVNAFMRSKMTGDDPAISGGQFRFDRKKTSAATVAQGQYFWKLDYAPIGIMERITVDRNIDLNLISDALGLAA